MKGWRTVLVNAGLAVLWVAAEVARYLAGFDWAAIVPPDRLPYVLLMVNVANIILRVITTTPVGHAR